MIRAVSIISAVAVLSPSLASAAGYKTVCARGGDARTIEVVAPGDVGQSCDVRYTRSESNVSVPYHADNSDDYCNEKARALAQRLSAAGFNCSSSAPVLRADADRPAQQSDYVVETQRIAPAEDVAPEAQPAEQQDEAAMTSSGAAQETASRAVASEPAPASTASDTDEDVLESEMNEILAQPATEPSTTAPAQLVTETTQMSQARPQPSPVGRLTGADPDTPQPAASPTPVSTAAQPAQESQTEKKEPAAPAAEQSPPVQQPAALRSPADVVRATLSAQAAAWNDGDLDGFMEGYWKSDELKFVSGADITRGWSATMKRYRDRYTGGEGLGRLSFERIEPKLVTENVAVVTGRFNLLRDDGSSSGVFTLVMRRDNGVWRIVHDHTNADQAPQ